MATYFAGNMGILGGEDGGDGRGGGGLGLHTMVLMNPTTYVHFNSVTDQDPPPNSSAAGNFLLFNPSAAAGNLLASPHAPTQHVHDENRSDNNDNVSGVLHGFIPRVYGTPVEAARQMPRAQQGLSLGLPSEKRSSLVVSSGMQGLVLSSKYLKAAQKLLDEVASVNNNNNNTTSTENNNSSKSLLSKKSGDDVDEKAAGESAGGDVTNGKVAAELSAAERQEIQMKKAKLVTMLDEVDQRYKQYNNQMKIIVSSFEQVAGSGSAKTYTSLALKTISKQFRCLKDAIVAQIKAVNKSLGEEEAKIEGGSSSSSRLKFVDHHLRQQRALQQLGMIHHNNNNAWRPQRGLPERAVSVLRSWLFEHFLHPYPKDSDKIMLAKQTGLTRSQVSNWFINARVRLWKPMVEEMYVEEMKEQDKNNGSSKEKANPNEHHDEDSMSKSVGYRDKPEECPVSEVPQNNFMNNSDHSSITMSIPMTASASATGFSVLAASEFEGMTQGTPKKLRTTELLHSPACFPSVDIDANKVGEASNDSISPRFRDEKEFSFVASNKNFMGGFGAYPIGETGRFEAEPFTPSYSGNNNNGVSLTLGLPHCESFTVSATHQNFFPDQSIQLGRTLDMSEPNEFGAINTSESHSSAAAYNTISLQNQRRFAAQLLPDFVT